MPEKTAYVKQLQGLSFAARMTTNHWMVMDTTIEAGGMAAASTPKELILAALAGCTGMDVASILQKKRLPVDSIEMFLTGQESEEHPKIFTSIHIEFVIRGRKIPAKDVEKAIEASQTKYCSVSHMLKNSVNITTSYRIEEPIS